MPDITNIRPREMYVGDTEPDYVAVYRDDDGDAQNISAWITTDAFFRLRNNATGAVVTGAGTITVTDGANGEITYAWAVADTATAGTYDIIVRMNTGSGEFITLNATRQLIIKPLPS